MTYSGGICLVLKNQRPQDIHIPIILRSIFQCLRPPQLSVPLKKINQDSLEKRKDLNKKFKRGRRILYINSDER